MWILYVLLVISALLTTGLSGLADLAADKLKVQQEGIARQMYVYHVAAVATMAGCSSACPTGAVNVTAKLPSLAKGLSDGRFASYSNQVGAVVTVYEQGVGGARLSDAQVISGLRMLGQTQKYVGSWTGSVVTTSAVDASGAPITRAAGNPPGYTHHSGQPVIMDR